MRVLLVIGSVLVTLSIPLGASSSECQQYEKFPQVVQEVNLRGSIDAIEMVGDHALVAREYQEPDSTNLLVVDLQQLNDPKVVGGMVIPGGVSAIATAGDLGYLAGVQVGLLIVDFSNPATPSILGHADFPGRASGVAVQGSFAYVTGDTSGLHVIDISDPQNPVLVGSVDTPGYAEDVAVSGSYAFVADYQYGLQVVDVSNPAAPSIVASLDTPGDAFRLYIRGHHVFLADRESAFLIIDISNPLSPVRASTYQGFCLGIAGTDSIALMNNGCWVNVLNVSNPASPQLEYAIDFPVHPDAVFLADSYFLIGDNWSTNGIESVLDVFRYSALDSPPPLGRSEDPGVSYDVVVAGRTAYLAEGAFGLSVVDVSNPAHPVLLGAVDTPGVAGSVAVQGYYAYVADGTGGLQVVDVTRPIAPSIVESFPTPAAARDVVVNGSYAYVAADSSGFLVLDISYPTHPIEVGSVTPPGVALKVAAGGGVLYGSTSQGLYLIDVSVPAAPTVIASYPIYGSTVALGGPNAYILEGGTGLRIYDVSNPKSPALLGSVALLTGGTDIVVVGQFVYLAGGEGGLQIVDVSNPSVPTLVGGSYQVNDTNAVASDGEYVYLASGAMYSTECTYPSSIGLQIYPLECSEYTDVLPAPKPAPPLHYQLGPSRPNPVRTGTLPAVIPFSLEHGALVTLGVYDVEGRQVRSLIREWRAQGSNEVNWDGRDDYGRALPAGVYLYRLETSGFQSVRRLVFLP